MGHQSFIMLASLLHPLCPPWQLQSRSMQTILTPWCACSHPVDIVTGDKDLLQLIDDEKGVHVLYTGVSEWQLLLQALHIQRDVSSKASSGLMHNSFHRLCLQTIITNIFVRGLHMFVSCAVLLSQAWQAVDSSLKAQSKSPV